MNKPVKIDRSYKWVKVLVAVAGCLVAIGAVLLSLQHQAAWPFMIAAGIVACSAIVAAIVIARAPFTIEVLPDGFMIHDRRGDREFTDDKVICASLWALSNYASGVLKSTTRFFDLWVEGPAGPERFKLMNHLPVGTRDPLTEFIGRVQLRLYERACATLAAGEPFEGEGWKLLNDEVVVTSGSAERVEPLGALAAAEIHESQLCVWRLGEDEPALRIPANCANAWILLRLLQEQIAKRQAGTAQPAGGPFGRVLYERKPGRAMAVLLTILVWGLPPGCVVGLIIAVAQAGTSALGLGLPLCFLGLVLWLAVVWKAIEFRVYELGIRRKSLFSTQQLKYTDVDVFTYSAVRKFVNGVYQGTHFKLCFTSKAGGKSKSLTYSQHLQHADEALVQVRDHVSQLIAHRMVQQLSSNQAVNWTDGLRFLPEGLEYREQGFFGTKAPVITPYSQIHGHDFDSGTLRVFVAGTKKPAAKSSTLRANFFPGYVCLLRLLESRQAGKQT